nr:hypothetical protein CFP56_45097 [Quercus suber]
MEKIKDINKDLERFDLSEKDVTSSSTETATLLPNGLDMDPIIAVSKPEQNPATRVQHIKAHSSDHNPIIIRLEGILECQNKPFCFEQMWLKEEGYGDIVKAV